MRKAIAFASIIIYGCLIFPVRGMAVELPKSDPYESTQDKIQKDTIVALLFPKIDEAISGYYQKYFTDRLGTAPYFVDVLSVEGEKREPNLVNFSSFKAKVRISPYIGPHIPVGTDQITFSISMTGEVQVDRFEHIKSYELPWNYRGSAKGAWPPNE